MSDDSRMWAMAGGVAVYRASIWAVPGITVGYLQGRPNLPETIDWAIRPTGGGLVFHAPGDILVSCVIPASQFRSPGSLQNWIREWCVQLSGDLLACGIRVDNSLDAPRGSQTIDSRFCQTYPTPFEIVQNGSKVVAVAVRRGRHHVLVQSILHTTPAFPYFSEVQNWPMSKGLQPASPNLYRDLSQIWFKRFECTLYP